VAARGETGIARFLSSRAKTEEAGVVSAKVRKGERASFKACGRFHHKIPANNETQRVFRERWRSGANSIFLSAGEFFNTGPRKRDQFCRIRGMANLRGFCELRLAKTPPARPRRQCNSEVRAGAGGPFVEVLRPRILKRVDAAGNGKFPCFQYSF